MAVECDVMRIVFSGLCVVLLRHMVSEKVLCFFMLGRGVIGVIGGIGCLNWVYWL